MQAGEDNCPEYVKTLPSYVKGSRRAGRRRQRRSKIQLAVASRCLLPGRHCFPQCCAETLCLTGRSLAKTKTKSKTWIDIYALGKLNITVVICLFCLLVTRHPLDMFKVDIFLTIAMSAPGPKCRFDVETGGNYWQNHCSLLDGMDCMGFYDWPCQTKLHYL